MGASYADALLRHEEEEEEEDRLLLLLLLRRDDDEEVEEREELRRRLLLRSTLPGTRFCKSPSDATRRGLGATMTLVGVTITGACNEDVPNDCGGGTCRT